MAQSFDSPGGDRCLSSASPFSRSLVFATSVEHSRRSERIGLFESNVELGCVLLSGSLMTTWIARGLLSCCPETSLVFLLATVNLRLCSYYFDNEAQATVNPVVVFLAWVPRKLSYRSALIWDFVNKNTEKVVTKRALATLPKKQSPNSEPLIANH